ncbi:MAG: hypothetical protein QM487_06565 [Candidatus Marithrix sp.]
MKNIIISLIIIMTSFISPVYAESAKFVQWWGDYLPKHGKIYPGGYRNRNSIQYQDLNEDGIYNDALIWYEFDLNKPFSPASYNETGKEQHRYRTDFPSAIFYGGIIARFTNVSDVTTEDRRGDRYNPFNKVAQATVQPTEGSRPCSYAVDYPNNSSHSWGDKKQRADMTLFLVEPAKWKQPFSNAFYATKDANVNFSVFYIWKKEGFINGGAGAKQITFNATSKLSVNLTRRRDNIEEGRFIVQDGEQFWISEAKIIHNEKTDKFSTGVDGMSVEALKRGAVVQLNPLNSRWAKYNPRQDTVKVDDLVTTLEEINYKPKKSTDEEIKLYQTTSDELLLEVNKMQFEPQNATFVEHKFQDVQAVGVYFATYTFSHETTILVFDNFQAWAVGKVPEGKAINFNQTNTTAKITGSVSVNCGPYERIATQCIPDNIKIKGKITVDSSDIGKSADILAIAIHKPYPESKTEQFYSIINEGKAVAEWDGNLENLQAFQRDIELQSEHDFFIYQGKIQLSGFMQILFGYRLQDGSIIYNADSIDMFMYTESINPKNDLLYSESIEGLLCSEEK